MLHTHTHTQTLYSVCATCMTGCTGCHYAVDISVQHGTARRRNAAFVPTTNCCGWHHAHDGQPLPAPPPPALGQGLQALPGASPPTTPKQPRSAVCPLGVGYLYPTQWTPATTHSSMCHRLWHLALLPNTPWTRNPAAPNGYKEALARSLALSSTMHMSVHRSVHRNMVVPPNSLNDQQTAAAASCQHCNPAAWRGRVRLLNAGHCSSRCWWHWRHCYWYGCHACHQCLTVSVAAHRPSQSCTALLGC